MNVRKTAPAALAFALAAALGGCALVERGGEETAELAREVENSEFWTALEENWDDFKSAAAERWNDLTEDDLDDVGGNREELIEEVQEAYSVTREEAEEQVDEWAASMS